MPRRCERVQLPDGTVALVTVNTPPRRPCTSCGQLTDTLCDFPLRGKKAGRTCSKRVCARCKTVIGKNLDLCPAHAAFVREHQLEPRLAPLLADDNRHGHAVALDLIDEAGICLPPAFRPKKYYELDKRFGRVPGMADWHEFFTERAAILEYEGGMSREDAEKAAYALAGDRPMP